MGNVNLEKDNFFFRAVDRGCGVVSVPELG